MNVRAEFACAIRKVAAERERLVEPPPFDRAAFGALAAEVDHLIAEGEEGRADKLIDAWQREQLRQIERSAA